MLLSGTVVADADTVVEDGAVVTVGSEIAFVGDSETARERYPDHEQRSFDIVAPGIVGAHVHSVQSLGRGIADDVPLLEWLFDHVLPMEAAMDGDEMWTAAALGYLECLSSGVTTVVDHLSVNHAGRAFAAAGEVGIRGLLGKVMMDRDAPDGLEEDADEALADSERLIREYHGAFDDRIRYAVTPRFAVSCTESCLRGARDLADEHDGVRIHTHASENREEVAEIEDRTGMRNIEWLNEIGLTGPDVTLAHCVWTDQREREILEETDTVVVHCPSANMKLASGVAPVSEYLDRDVSVALGNDGPPCNNTLDPFTEMRQAALLQRVDRLDATALPASTVFRMATEHGALAAGFDVGVLREGRPADVIGLSSDVPRTTPVRDVHSHLVFTAHGDDVRFSMVDGSVVYDDGTFPAVDADRILADAQRYSERFA